VTGSWKTYLLGTSKFFEKTRIKSFKNIFQTIFFTHLDNLTNVVSCYEISQPKPLFPKRYGWLRISDQSMCQKVRFSKIPSHIHWQNNSLDNNITSLHNNITVTSSNSLLQQHVTVSFNIFVMTHCITAYTADPSITIRYHRIVTMLNITALDKQKHCS